VVSTVWQFLLLLFWNFSFLNPKFSKCFCHLSPKISKMFFGMESVAYFPKFFQIYTHPHPKKKNPSSAYFSIFFCSNIYQIGYHRRDPPKKIVTTLQKFTPKQKKPPPVDICSFTSIFCKNPGVKENIQVEFTQIVQKKKYGNHIG